MDKDTQTSLLGDVAEYYSDKLAKHGVSARGVDWNSEDGQLLRFEQLCKLFGSHAGEAFSVADFGCGYGALYDFMSARVAAFSYLGLDVSEKMIAAARDKFKAQARARFEVGSRPSTVSDYTVASGIFNVRLHYDDARWKQYIVETLDTMHETSSAGFSFNCLTSYSDVDKRRDYLHYADPCELFDLCKRRYARDVALLHDYPLYEFTILVRKSQ